MFQVLILDPYWSLVELVQNRYISITNTWYTSVSVGIGPAGADRLDQKKKKNWFMVFR